MNCLSKCYKYLDCKVEDAYRNENVNNNTGNT